MRRLPILLAILSSLTACAPFPVHTDCLGSSGCGYAGVKASAQSIAVSGGDRAEARSFEDGRGRCDTYSTVVGFNNESRVVRIFIITLWLPATAPRYRIELRITGSRGPGHGSTADNERFLYDPANGPIVQADVNLVPSPDRIAMPTNVVATIDSGERSGSLLIELPDRTISGTWTCAASASKP
jgi:hypothetical protein